MNWNKTFFRQFLIHQNLGQWASKQKNSVQTKWKAQPRVGVLKSYTQMTNHNHIWGTNIGWKDRGKCCHSSFIISISTNYHFPASLSLNVWAFSSHFSTLFQMYHFHFSNFLPDMFYVLKPLYWCKIMVLTLDPLEEMRLEAGGADIFRPSRFPSLQEVVKNGECSRLSVLTNE